MMLECDVMGCIDHWKALQEGSFAWVVCMVQCPHSPAIATRNVVSHPVEEHVPDQGANILHGSR